MVDGLTRAFACIYRDRRHQPPCEDHKRSMEAEARRLFATIPVPVVFRKGPEPFGSLEEMARAVCRDRVLVMRDYEFKSCVWGDAYNELRAVHDWYGHLGGHGAFTIPGEIESYHVTEGLFSPTTNPFVWCETVLANAYADTYGKHLGWDKVVLSGPHEIAKLLDVGDLPGWVA